MTPTLVHRYAFPIQEAIETLLGDAAGDCEAWRIRIEGDEVVIDVIAPVPGIVPSLDDLSSLERGRFADAENGPETTSKASVSVVSGSDSQTHDPEPELKGGPLARRAGIACAEPGFAVFLGVRDEMAATDDIYRRCGITTRKMLDHDDRAAAVWRDIDGKYRLWLEGHDVELDPVNDGDSGHE